MFSKQAFVLVISGVYVLFLGFTKKLNLYIHPRYITFTVVFAAIALGLVLYSSFNTAKPSHSHKSSRISLLPIFIILGVALLVPARSLTSATVSQRATDSGSLISTANSQPLNSLFSGSSRGLRLADWYRLLASNDDPSYYVNKPAKISGFIYDAGLGPDTVWLARFVVTCCAVDAQPVGVPVQIKNWQAEYQQDQWVEVEGSFELAQTTNGQEIILIPETVQSIDEPSNPYAN